MMIFAHRGASRIAPENTLASVKKAFELNADGVEFDIHITKDQKLVLMHDDTILRTGGKDIIVADSNYDDIKDIDVGSFFSPQFLSEHIPLMSQVIDIVPTGKYMQIEIKSDIPVDLLLNELRNADKGLSEFIIISFNVDILKRIKKAEEEILTLWINGEYDNKHSKMQSIEDMHKVVSLKEIDGLAFDSRFKMSKDDINSLRNNGLGILFAWTVDDINLAKELYDLGIDAIATNDLKTILAGNFNR